MHPAEEKLRLIRQILECEDPEVLQIISQVLQLRRMPPGFSAEKEIQNPASDRPATFSEGDLADLQQSINEVFLSGPED
jgi:hypothetical protein